jgi:hypothetical protein
VKRRGGGVGGGERKGRREGGEGPGGKDVIERGRVMEKGGRMN